MAFPSVTNGELVVNGKRLFLPTFPVMSDKRVVTHDEIATKTNRRKFTIFTRLRKILQILQFLQLQKVFFAESEVWELDNCAPEAFPSVIMAQDVLHPYGKKGT